jgi:four helix bundle protein
LQTNGNRYSTSRIWHLASGIWHPASGIRHLASGIWHKDLVMTRGTSFGDLEIYRQAHELGVRTHHFSLTLPRHELYESGSQLRRSSKAISVNIVEGYGRKQYKANFVQFLVYSLSTCDETVEWLRYIGECYPEKALAARSLEVEFDALSRKINAFIRSVESQHRT